MITEKDLFAGLTTDPNYIALCDYLQSQVDYLADELADAKDTNDSIRLLRVWQITRKFVITLKTAPHEMKLVIDQVKQRDPEEPVSTWRELDESDMFRRRGPVPPPQAKI